MKKKLHFSLGVLLTSFIITASLFSPISSVSPVHARDASITDIQVVQVLGKQLMDSKEYVAGKESVVRAVLSGAVAVDPTTQKVVVTVGGENFTLEPSSSNNPVDVLDFTCPSMDYCLGWKAGEYSIEATVGSDTQKIEGINFLERRSLRILALPVNANYGGGKTKAAGETWKRGGFFMKQVYPVSSANFNWKLGQELDTSGAEFDLSTEEGRQNLWIAIASQQPQECANNPALENCFDLIVGFIPERIDIGGGLALQGYTYGPPANIVVESDNDMPATVAHEVAHLYGIGDEYDGGGFLCDVNPPPPDFKGNPLGQDGDNTLQCKESNEKPYKVGSGSEIDAVTWIPFEVGGRGLLPDMISFMGSGATQEENWISAPIYQQIFKSLDPQASPQANQPGTLKLASQAKDQIFIYASGFIPKDDTKEIRFDPWYAYEDTNPFKEEKGDYTLEALDADGKILAKQGFKVNFVANTNPPTSLKEAPFEVGMPFPDETVSFAIKKGTKVIGERVISENAPTIKLTKQPKAGETVDGKFTFEWTAEDEDNDKLYYSVEFSPDGNEDNYFELADQLTATKWTEDFTDFPGGDKAVVRVWVSDGINTEVATSLPFKVTVKPPEVFIEYPEDGETFEKGDEIELVGSAYDLQLDDWLIDEEALTWTIDGKTAGQGEYIYVDDLTVGSHKVTLTAKNEQGKSASDTIEIIIE